MAAWTPAREEAALARCEAATPEPWDAQEWGADWTVLFADGARIVVGDAIYSTHRSRPLAVFIAHSRTDLHDCIAALRAEREARQAAEKRVAELEERASRRFRD